MIPSRALDTYLKQAKRAWRKHAYPDQGGGDPRSWEMPTLNNDQLPMSPTPLGPCERCGDGMVRDAEGVYCPSCGHRSNPDVQNSRIDMYAPLGEGIGEGPFDLMSAIQPDDEYGHRHASYWVMEGSNLPWWLPSKTAADVRQLAEQARQKLWQRDDLARLRESWAAIEMAMGFDPNDSDYHPEADTGLGVVIRAYEQWQKSKGSQGPSWDQAGESIRDILKRNYGYSDHTIDQWIDDAPKIAPLWNDYLQANIYKTLLDRMADQYPGGYKLMPWAVSQLKRQLSVEGVDTTTRDVYHMADIAGQLGQVLTELRQQNRLPQGFDINQMPFEQAEEWLQNHLAEHVGDGWEERKVVAKLPNGWTVEEVNTPEDLKREGELMGHCVGGYCNQVQSGRSVILSLRDPNGGPHVTMEYLPTYEQTNEDGTPVDPNQNQWINSNKITGYQIQQIQGKSDLKPKPEYQQMISEFNQYLQGEGYKIRWADQAWRHYDNSANNEFRTKLRNDNTYHINTADDLHRLHNDYNQNGGVTHFTEQVPDQPDEYGVMSPSGVPQRWLDNGEMQNATNEILDEVFNGTLSKDQWETWAQKLLVGWYSLLAQPYASDNTSSHSPKSPVDARTWLVNYISDYERKMAAAWNGQLDRGAPVPQTKGYIDSLNRIQDFNRIFTGMKGADLFNWTTPDNGPVLDPKTPKWFRDDEQRRIDNPDDPDDWHLGKVTPDGYQLGPREFVPYRFLIGKDQRMYGGPFSTHESLADHYGLFDDPGWTEVARGEYGPDGTQTLATWGDMAGDRTPQDLAQQVHDWGRDRAVDDADWMPVPNGEVNHAHFTKGQGFARQQFRIASAWKYSVAGIPANYTEEDPLDLQGKQPVFDNMQVDWWKLPPAQQRQAIVNAFRATMLSPRLNLKNNAIMYQEFMGIPADESDPDVFEQHARDLKERWDRQGQSDVFDEVQPMGWEQVVPGKLIPGFWGNIRRLAALGPYADDLRQAALDDLNKNGGRGDLFRQEVLKMGIPGVGPKVASFAWLALNPKGSDLATIDVWMMRHLNQDSENPNSPSHYFDLENQLRDEKDQMYGPNTPLGQYQWGVWDKIRTPGYHQDHSPLKVYEPTPYTDVAWSPQYRAPRPQILPEQHPDQTTLFAKVAAASLTDMQEGEEILPYEHHDAITNEQGIKAYVDGEPAGNVTYQIFPNDYLYAHWIYVEPEYRESGVMRQMIDELYRRYGLPISGEFFNRTGLEQYIEKRNIEMTNATEVQPWNLRENSKVEFYA